MSASSMNGPKLSVPDDALKGIGAAITHWAFAEQQIQLLVTGLAAIAKKSDDKVDAKTPYHVVEKRWKRLKNELLKDHPEIYGLMNKFMAEAKSTQIARNHIGHWVANQISEGSDAIGLPQLSLVAMSFSEGSVSKVNLSTGELFQLAERCMEIASIALRLLIATLAAVSPSQLKTDGSQSLESLVASCQIPTSLEQLTLLPPSFR